jgi:hypothetical protein
LLIFFNFMVLVTEVVSERERQRASGGPAALCETA